MSSSFPMYLQKQCCHSLVGPGDLDLQLISRLQIRVLLDKMAALEEELYGATSQTLPPGFILKSAESLATVVERKFSFEMLLDFQCPEVNTFLNLICPAQNCSPLFFFYLLIKVHLNIQKCLFRSFLDSILETTMLNKLKN